MKEQIGWNVVSESSKFGWPPKKKSDPKTIAAKVTELTYTEWSHLL